MEGWKIALITLSVIIVIVIIILLLYFFVFKKKKQNNNEPEKKKSKTIDWDAAYADPTHPIIMQYNEDIDPKNYKFTTYNKDIRQYITVVDDRDFYTRVIPGNNWNKIIEKFNNDNIIEDYTYSPEQVIEDLDKLNLVERELSDKTKEIIIESSLGYGNYIEQYMKHIVPTSIYHKDIYYPENEIIFMPLLVERQLYNNEGELIKTIDLNNFQYLEIITTENADNILIGDLFDGLNNQISDKKHGLCFKNLYTIFNDLDNKTNKIITNVNTSIETKILNNANYTDEEIKKGDIDTARNEAYNYGINHGYTNFDRTRDACLAFARGEDGQNMTQWIFSDKNNPAELKNIFSSELGNSRHNMVMTDIAIYNLINNGNAAIYSVSNDQIKEAWGDIKNNTTRCTSTLANPNRNLSDTINKTLTSKNISDSFKDDRYKIIGIGKSNLIFDVEKETIEQDENKIPKIIRTEASDYFGNERNKIINIKANEKNKICNILYISTKKYPSIKFIMYIVKNKPK